jgi:hypothetical protein
MSNQIIKIIVFVLSIFIVFSCNTQSDTKIAKTVSIDKIGYENYIKVYKSANDSIKSWVDNKLTSCLGERLFSWRVDSLICFNNETNKCIMALPVRCTFWKDCVQDELKYFYGIKMKNKWYFFKGPSVVLPREMYQENTNTPLSFEKLHEIAMKQIYGGYLKPKGFLGLGGYEINEDFFRDIEVRDAYNYPFTTQESWEESWLRLMRENWDKKDTTVYKSDQ